MFRRKHALLAASAAFMTVPLCVSEAAIAQDAMRPEAAQATDTAESSTSMTNRQIAEKLGAMIAQRYTYADKAGEYESALRKAASAGTYDNLHGKAFASKLLEDLEAIHKDGHLNVIFEPTKPKSDMPAAEAQDVPSWMQDPDAMEKPRWLAPGIAFVRYNLFSGSEGEVKATEDFLTDYAAAKVIVIDLRTHRGGGLAEIDTIAARLFAKPMPLVVMSARKSAAEILGPPPPPDDPHFRPAKTNPEYVGYESWVVPDGKGPASEARVYLLTSQRTASAAEHFALSLKRTGRATLVGSRTFGANHFGTVFPIGGGIAAFIPYGRTYDPDTGLDWEGTGIEPDVAVEPKEALKVVLEREGLDKETAQRLSDSVAPPEKTKQKKA